MEFIFWGVAFLLIISAVGVVTMRNPLHSALMLVLHLSGVAAIYALLEAHFLAVVQIIVYAGAIMVLVIFVLMLLSVKEEDSGSMRFFATSFSLALAVCFLFAIGAPIFEEFSGTGGGDDLLSLFSTAAATEAKVGSVRNIGLLLYSKFVFPFEAASLLIMAAIVGAAMLARRGAKRATGDSV